MLSNVTCSICPIRQSTVFNNSTATLLSKTSPSVRIKDSNSILSLMRAWECQKFCVSSITNCVTTASAIALTQKNLHNPRLLHLRFAHSLDFFFSFPFLSLPQKIVCITLLHKLFYTTNHKNPIVIISRKQDIILHQHKKD